MKRDDAVEQYAILERMKPGCKYEPNDLAQHFGVGDASMRFSLLALERMELIQSTVVNGKRRFYVPDSGDLTLYQRPTKAYQVPDLMMERMAEIARNRDEYPSRGGD